ncbi:Ascochitine biosynthesis cluster MFS transporter [Psilocybe cubensis]|uniref:Major facilitator superfamily (MFS) profile domain-containing protein n=2 Tax=Psilocybe cubensis TaxID=181762 RepID=A0A8H7XTP2_PSICU|nr:Ascochitine biosynthesis cluster MFS transporter [Psilocybe cubensis]KAH9479807.1 Ascochitine biosynthesis cluster MFS transporter [Psilocybe cubensis]
MASSTTLSAKFTVDGEKSATPTLYVSEPDISGEGVVVKSLEDVREPSLDPRVHISNDSRPDEKELDEGLGHRLTRMLSSAKSSRSEEEGKTNEPIYIEFAPGDKRNPINYSLRKKWAITSVACFATLLASSTSSTYNMGFESMTRDLGCTDFQATIGLSVYALGFGVVPLVTASFSEEFGRQPLYLGSGVGFLLMFMMIALAKNIQTVIIARLLQGAFGSTGATMVGGTIADIWTPKERGLPMSIFGLMAVGGTGLGPVIAGWIEVNRKLGWKWIQWIQMMICAVYLIILPFIMKETRSSILLTRIAKKLRKETGDHRYRARVEDERAKLRTLIWISCTRPVHLMLTEPVVSSFSLWIGFAWGVTYCMIESISGVFRDLHDFDIGWIGTVFMAMVIGSIFGFITNFYQESLYQRYFPHRGPEARLYLACFAAILLPVGMFIYAWSSFSSVHWIALTIGITLFIWGVFIIYLAVFTYLADCYGPFASSALAGQSLARNLMATAFPLFTTQMYRTLDYKWANTLFGCIAAVMIPIPYVLFFYGPAIRLRSKFSRAVLEAERR